MTQFDIHHRHHHYNHQHIRSSCTERKQLSCDCLSFIFFCFTEHWTSTHTATTLLLGSILCVPTVPCTSFPYFTTAAAAAFIYHSLNATVYKMLKAIQVRRFHCVCLLQPEFLYYYFSFSSLLLLLLLLSSQSDLASSYCQACFLLAAHYNDCR